MLFSCPVLLWYFFDLSHVSFGSLNLELYLQVDRDIVDGMLHVIGGVHDDLFAVYVAVDVQRYCICLRGDGLVKSES
jgi:hypothetical protein